MGAIDEFAFGKRITIKRIFGKPFAQPPCGTLGFEPGLFRAWS